MLGLIFLCLYYRSNLRSILRDTSKEVHYWLLQTFDGLPGLEPIEEEWLPGFITRLHILGLYLSRSDLQLAIQVTQAALLVNGYEHPPLLRVLVE